MKYKLIDNSQNNINKFLKTVIYNRGIKEEDYEEFINSNNYDLEGNTYSNLDNIGNGAKIILNHVINNDMISLVVDPDVDGITSSAILLSYLENAIENNIINIKSKNKNEDGFYINWDLITHSGKGHGLSDDIKINKNTKLIILPDGGSNDIDEHKKWHDAGVDIVVIDHHQITKETKDAIIINNQTSKNYTNKDFSGVGVVYRLLQAFDNILFDSQANDYLDLVALGNISDLMDTKSYETRFFIHEGLKKDNLKNDFLKALLKFTKSNDGNDFIYYMYPIDIGFKISPLLNALMRMGNSNDKLDLFKCFVSKDVDKLYKSNYEKCLYYKKKQDEEKLNLMELLDNDIIENQSEQPVLILDATKYTSNNEILGLTAMNIVGKYKKPTLIVINKDNLYFGSARVPSGFPDKHFRTLCESSGLFEFAQGHEFAFGLSFKLENTSKIQQLFLDKYGKMDLQNSYDVDFIIKNISEISPSDFYRIQVNKFLWGSGFEEPLFVLEDIPIFFENAKILGENKNTIKYTYHNVDFMFFRRTENDEMKQLIDNYDLKKSYSINIVGKLGMNTFMRRSTSQVIVEDYQIVEYKDTSMNDFAF